MNTEQAFEQKRERMREQLAQRGIRDQRVLQAMHTVPRHCFVAEQQQEAAYEDRPLPIGYRQTISQPYMIAVMLEALELKGDERVLEVGTGSGYQAALLGRLAAHVYSVEIVAELAQQAKAVLARLGYDNVEVIEANGSLGWPAGAPYDAIIIAAASPTVPERLTQQLREGGRLLVPVGDSSGQTLLRVRKREGKVVTENLGYCAFVPLVGTEGWQPYTGSPPGP